MSSHSVAFWFDILCFFAWLYLMFHWTPVIAFLDHLIAVPS